MVLLEAAIIGGAVYYYKKHHKENKARKAAFLAGQPFRERDGSMTYPPNYPGLPPYSSAVEERPTAREYYSNMPINQTSYPNEKTGLVSTSTQEANKDWRP